MKQNSPNPPRRLRATLKQCSLLFALCNVVCVMACQAQADLDRRVELLLAQMTLEEKVGQMTLLELSMVSSDDALDPAKLEDVLVQHHVGALLSTRTLSLERWREVIGAVQDVATQQTRLGVPLLFGIDAVHGQNYLANGTLFPQNIALAATWDPEHVRSAAAITALETRACGVSWNFAPVFDVVRQPLWSRVFETFGEDPYLVSVMGRAAVEGLQGNDLAAPDRVAATAKHFIGYGMPLSGMDRTPAWIPERMLREVFLPPFRAAFEAGVASVMVNSGEVNGEPVHASHTLLTGLLRDEMGFEGVIVSDWADVEKLHHTHRVAASMKEAVRMAVLAGVDMSMAPLSLDFYDYLIDLVGEGAVPEARIDASVRRILKLKFKLGLFDDPYPDPAVADRVGHPDFRTASLQASQEAITLLKNTDGLLPLSKTTRVLVTGPGATSLSALHGAWTYSWQGRDEALYPDDTRNVLEALHAEIGAERVTYVPGAGFDEEIDVAAAVEAAEAAEVAIVVLGEDASVEQPGSIEDLRLPAAQTRLALALEATGTPVVVVLLENRPRIIRALEADAAAVVMAYEPGMFGAEAVADVLFGDVNPSGKLPFTYPRYTGAVVPYDHKHSERFTISEGREAYHPQWEFGHGLSYTSFAYSDLTLDRTTMSADEELTVSVHVANTGDRAGKEVVQLYVRDLYASVTPSVRRLRRFEKVSLPPGDARVVTFTLGKEDLSFIGLDNTSVLEAGGFQVMVGGLEAPFTVR